MELRHRAQAAADRWTRAALSAGSSPPSPPFIPASLFPRLTPDSDNDCSVPLACTRLRCASAPLQHLHILRLSRGCPACRNKSKRRRSRPVPLKAEPGDPTADPAQGLGGGEAKRSSSSSPPPDFTRLIRQKKKRKENLCCPSRPPRPPLPPPLNHHHLPSQHADFTC